MQNPKTFIKVRSGYLLLGAGLEIYLNVNALYGQLPMLHKIGTLGIKLAGRVGIEPTPKVLEAFWTPCPTTYFVVGSAWIEHA